MAGALAFGAVEADARGSGCDPCYFIGITPAPGGPAEGGGFQGGGFRGGGLQADTGHDVGQIRRRRQGGYGGYRYEGGHYRGY
jgi:hypothetical protein